MSQNDTNLVDPGPSFYRTMAHSFYCFAMAGLKVFGTDPFIKSIKLTRSPYASKIQDAENTLLLPHPFYYNLCQSLELALKGFLSFKGYTQKEIREFMSTALIIDPI